MSRPRLVVAALVLTGVALAAVLAHDAFPLAIAILFTTGLIAGSRPAGRLVDVFGAGAVVAVVVQLVVGAADRARFGTTLGQELNRSLTAIIAAWAIEVCVLLPGYLFGRAYRRWMGSDLEWVDDPSSSAERGQAKPAESIQEGASVTEPSPKAYVAMGCALTVAVLVLVWWLVQQLSRMGP
jgi:hypothetical protein